MDVIFINIIRLYIKIKYKCQNLQKYLGVPNRLTKKNESVWHQGSGP